MRPIEEFCEFDESEGGVTLAHPSLYVLLDSLDLGLAACEDYDDGFWALFEQPPRVGLLVMGAHPNLTWSQVIKSCKHPVEVDRLRRALAKHVFWRDGSNAVREMLSDILAALGDHP